MTNIKYTVYIFIILCCIINAQRITSNSRHFVVDLSKDVTLPCNVENFNNDYGIIWMRGNDVIFLDGDPIIGDSHYKLIEEGNNHSLYIDRVEAFDEANYTCMVSVPTADIKVIHSLKVHTLPSVTITPKRKEVYPRFGESLTLMCTVTGNPPPEKTWKFNGNTIPFGAQLLPSGGILLKDIDDSFNGVYECKAKNKYNKESSAKINVKAVPQNYEFIRPSVTTDRTYIPTKEGENVEINCHYTGSPVPEAKWTLNGKSIDKNKHMIITAKYEKNSTTTTLKLHTITADEFGDYECSANNGIGTDARIIHLNDKPGKPFLESVDNRSLSWTVESAVPVDHYRVYYRRAGEDKFVDYKIFASNKNDQVGNVWSRTEKLDFLKSDTEYELQVKAQNKQGLGSFATDYKKIHIPADNYNKKDNSNTGSTLLLNIPALLITLYILKN